MHFNGETWLRILILLFGLIVSASCLRGSELILHASKAKQTAKVANVTGIEGEVSDVEGTGANSTTGEKSLLTGIPQIDYIHDPNLPRELNGYNLSNYPFYNSMPGDIDFKCDGLHDGFYASVPHYCQVYHHCLYGIRYDFLCANYTAFDQKTFICHFVSEVDCNNSPKYYQRNEALYKTATTSAPVKTTTTTKATTPAPKKADDNGRRPGPFRPRRPPYRRRPSYEYYDNAEDYYDDYYYYDPPARKRPGRNKGYRGDYYGGERAGGHKMIHREPPRRKPLKPLYEDEDEDYEYYYDSADGSKDDDNRRRPLDNNYRKPVDRDRPYLNKKRDKDVYVRDRNDKKKRIEDDYGNSRKNDDDRRLRNKYKGFAQRSKYDRDEDDDEIASSRRYQDDKRDKNLKNRPESSKRVTDGDKAYRSKVGKSTTPFPEEDDYEDIAATPKWKSRFQQRRPAKEDSKRSDYFSNSEELEESNGRKGQNSERVKESTKEKPQETNDGVPTFNPQIYARQPSKLYSQVKVETRPPPVQRNKDLYKSDAPATTMSSFRRPSNTRTGFKDRGSAEVERAKPTPKYTTPSLPEVDDYEIEDSFIDDSAPAKSYYEEEVSETYLTEQFPSKSAPVQQPSRNYRDQSQSDVQKSAQRSKSNFSPRYKPVTDRPTTAPTKPQTTQRTTTKAPVTESQFVPYEPSQESQPASFSRSQVTERQTYTYTKQTVPERQSQTLYQRQPYSERQAQAEKPVTEKQLLPERQFSERLPSSDRLNLSERQPYSERQTPSERQPYSERQTPSERQPYSERQTPSERQQYLDRQALAERQQYSERQPLPERQQFSERQPTFQRQPVTERLNPFQRQPVTDRQVLTYMKQPVTDRQLIQYKQIVTERQILPYLRQTEVERKPVPFPKQPPRTFEITAPGPSGLGSRIEGDAVQRDKYVIQSDRPAGFSLRLAQNDYSNPLPPSTQIQRRPEDPSPEKTVTRPSFKPVRNYRAKPTPETQYHDSVRLETFPQRYITRTEDYEPVVVQNPRLSVIPQISHVTNTKEWYW